MKNIKGVYWKIRFLGWGFTKNQYIEGISDCLKMEEGGAWTLCRFKRRLGKRKGVVFLRGDRYPNASYERFGTSPLELEIVSQDSFKAIFNSEQPIFQALTGASICKQNTLAKFFLISISRNHKSSTI